MRELLAAGYDEEQILAYFERSYGEFVRLEPPLRGVNWLVWIAPVVGLLLGGARGPSRAALPTGDCRKRRRAFERAGEPLPGPDSLPADASLAAVRASRAGAGLRLAGRASPSPPDPPAPPLG